MFSFYLILNNLCKIKRVGDWKLIRGCAGLLTDWYNLTDFNHQKINRDEGIRLSLTDDKTKNCLKTDSLPDSTHNYFLFNIKGIKLYQKII
jgi:hypothetical protein